MGIATSHTFVRYPLFVRDSVPMRWEWKNPWGRVRLDHGRERGYWLDRKLQIGFPDNPDLSERERLVIARWGKAIAPAELSSEQRRLLAENPPRPSLNLTEATANNWALQAPSMAALYDSLTEEEQELVRDPFRSRERPGARYPLTVGEIAAITGASERKIRNWSDEGLLPAFRERNDRRFYSAAMILAFVLRRTPTHTKAVIAAAARGEASQALQLLAATLGRAASQMPAHDAEQLTSLADALTAASHLMNEVERTSPSPTASAALKQTQNDA